jgi:hypothetical protein
MNIYNYKIKLINGKFHFYDMEIMKVKFNKLYYNRLFSFVGVFEFYETNFFGIKELDLFYYTSPYELNEIEKDKIIKLFEYRYKNNMIFIDLK